MASFTDLIAARIQEQRLEFLAGMVPDPQTPQEELLATSLRHMWRPLQSEAFGVISTASAPPYTMPPIVAVDGSRAIRALNTGADWIITQALLVGHGRPALRRADTVVLRGDVERPAVDRCGALLMRKLELDLALEFVTGLDKTTPLPPTVYGSFRAVLLLDGSLYAELPHLLYRLAAPGYEDLPLLVLERFLTLFGACERSGVLLLGVAKSARSTVLARAILHDHAQREAQAQRAMQADARAINTADALEGDVTADADVLPPAADWANSAEPETAAPTDGEMLYRWTAGAGITAPVLLGTASFGHRRAAVERDPQSLANMFENGSLTLGERRSILGRLRDAPAIGVCYLRLAPGEDALRLDALASQIGFAGERLLDLQARILSAGNVQPLAHLLLAGYGGVNVYNAPLYVVDREVRLHARTVDSVYLTVLRSTLQTPVQYDRSTRRFLG